MIKKYLKYIKESSIISKIDNDIITFAKLYNKENGYSNKSVYYSNLGAGKYISVADNPIDNFGYVIVGDLQLEKFIRNAEYDGMSDTLYMRALTDKVNKKYDNSEVINVAIDHNIKSDITKIRNYGYFFRPIYDKQIEDIMSKETIVEEGILIVDKNGEIKKTSKGDSWTIQYKESEDYIFTQFHSGWNVIMKENDFISKFMKDSEYLLNTHKYNL
jgi:hypothetical protein